MRSKKIYSAAEFDEGIRLALDKEQQESDAKWEEAVQQAFKDGLNRASEHITAEPIVHRLTVNITSSKLYYAKRGAFRKAREVFGSGYRLEIDRNISIADVSQHMPALFSITVIATKKERHAPVD